MADEHFFRQLARKIDVAVEYRMPFSRELEEALFQAVAMDLGLSPDEVETTIKLHSKLGASKHEVERFYALLR